ncbi:MAG: hypothetical protein RLZZ135_1675 [Cyanobacteriota bacterium]|jgi:uncharacterized protein YjbI with pentapeptide repeats
MNRSQLILSPAKNSDPGNAQTSKTMSSLRLPLLLIASSLVVGSVWSRQQTDLGHLDEGIQQLKQHIDRLPNTVKQSDRVNLERSWIALVRDRINTQNNVYNLLLQGVGVIILGGLIYTSWQHLRRTDAQFQQPNDKQITDRFNQAIAYLASDKVEIRLGGIYALERIGQESPTEYWLTIEVLTAFVRERSTQTSEKMAIPTGIIAPKQSRKLSSRRIPTDIQAIMTILSRRDARQDRHDRSIGLRESNLRAANLNGVELWGADLWRVNLREAQLWRAKLAGAFLGRANLSEASLLEADLHGAYLWKANFEGANLTEANLEQANLEGANLKDANLINTNLINADLRKVVGLTQSQLSKAICDETTKLPDYLDSVSGWVKSRTNNY